MKMDIGGALSWARFLFQEKNIEAGLLEAELLLAYILEVERYVLHREPGKELTAAEWSGFQGLVSRRLQGEPVAYLLGEREFMGLPFTVDGRVLVPRPETELLVEIALALLGGSPPAGGLPLALPFLHKMPPLPETGIVADIGTGSGAIALSLAHYKPGLEIYAVDISAAALELARHNAGRLGAGGRVNFIQGNLLEPLRGWGVRGRLALITANLPYIATADMDNLPRDVRAYEPSGALDGGPDGLDLYRQLIPEAVEYLAPGGCLLMEIGPGQGDALLKLFPPGCTGQLVNDLAGRERVVILKRCSVEF